MSITEYEPTEFSEDARFKAYRSRIEQWLREQKQPVYYVNILRFAGTENIHWLDSALELSQHVAVIQGYRDRYYWVEKQEAIVPVNFQYGRSYKDESYLIEADLGL